MVSNFHAENVEQLHIQVMIGLNSDTSVIHQLYHYHDRTSDKSMVKKDYRDQNVRLLVLLVVLYYSTISRQ